MSGALTIAPGAGQATADPILIRSQRAIVGSGSAGTIIPDCVVEEVGRDDLQITEHPVEHGATISDHAFKKPREVTLRWSWSNSGHYENFVQDAYAQLLTLQAQRDPFTIYTGKTAYANMLMASLGQTTNSGAEFTLNLVMVCREVIIVSTTAVGPSSGDKASQASPQKTTKVQSKGTQQLKSSGASIDMTGLSQLSSQQSLISSSSTIPTGGGLA